MGLFGRNKRETAEQLEALREELVVLRERLDAADAAKTRLEENVGSLHAENTRLRDELLVQITSASTTAGDATRSLAEQTAQHLEEQRARLADLAVVATDAAEQAASAAERAGTNEDRISATEQRVLDAASRLDAVDARITQVSTELANQLTELSNDLDAVQSAPAPAPSPAPVVQAQPAELDHELVEELLDAQERLAAEQARYQIAFREDLAELADRLRRER